MEELDNNNKPECPICCEAIMDEDLCKLNCGHMYHYNCILNSIKLSVNKYSKKCRECPYCREYGGYLELKPGIIPIKNVHAEYTNISGKSMTSKELEKYLVKGKCMAILKSGKNKGMQCQKEPLEDNKYCKRHSTLKKNIFTYFPVS